MLRALFRGGYPELTRRPELDPRDFYQSFVATYLERDLRSMLQVGSLRDFERFLRACAMRTSQLLNKAELARDVGVAPSTAGEWLSILQRSGVVDLLEPWFSNHTKTLVKTPKLHFMDTGLCAFLMGIPNENALLDSPFAPALWETAVFGECRRAEHLYRNWQIYFWRDRTKEADFLCHQAGKFRLMDAKWSEHARDAGRLPDVMKELDPVQGGSIVCRTPNPYTLPNGIEVHPLAGVSEWLET
jgi:predicted AAA+ superfamily ATPase